MVIIEVNLPKIMLDAFVSAQRCARRAEAQAKRAAAQAKSIDECLAAAKASQFAAEAFATVGSLSAHVMKSLQTPPEDTGDFEEEVEQILNKPN